MIKRCFFQNKNFKIWYYIKAVCRNKFANHKVRKRPHVLSHISQYDEADIQFRVHYYNKLEESCSIDGGMPVGQYRKPKRLSVYYYDSQEYLRYFEQDRRFFIEPGDVIHVPNVPTIVKSRPISDTNSNAVLLNMDKVRHFNFIQDIVSFKNKKDLLIGRGSLHQQHRKDFYTMYFDHALCDLGDTLKASPWYKPKISITDHLQYKFILALEGNDVATNLKWIMSSNSIAVMPRPKFETWFMEGTLIPNVHYIEIKDDYSDLEEVLQYYIRQEAACLSIIKNANTYIKQFQDQRKEDLISVMVLDKYFKKTNH